MESASVPIFTSDDVAALPDDFRVIAEHLAESGRVIIKGSSEESEKEA